MRRRIEICKKCSKLEECHFLDNQTEYICNALVFVFSQIPWGVEDWNKMDVPSNCEFYAEYFLSECNEENIRDMQQVQIV